MKNILTLILAAMVGGIQAQATLETVFDASCGCHIITNHNDDGTISSVHRELPDGTKTGLEQVYFPSGQLQYERTWLNGKLHGQGNHYHADGTIHYKEYHDKGVKTGVWSFYDLEGTVMQTITYNGNNSDGVYDYFHAGVKYFTQTVDGGKVVQEIVLQQEIYDTLKAEAEAARRAGKRVNN